MRPPLHASSLLRRLRALACACMAVTVLAPSIALAEPLSPELEHARAVGAAKIAATNATVPVARYPEFTIPGGAWSLAGPQWWVSGFLPGSLWYEYQRTGAPWARKAAEDRAVAIRPYASDPGWMDIGFSFLGSDVQDWRLTGDVGARDRALIAAHSLHKRYSPTVRLVCTSRTSEGYRVIADTMMNVELLFWGARNGGGEAIGNAARDHALRTIEDFVRPDGSTYHVVTYNERTGAVVRRGQSQGYADNTTWSRGHAWVLYGLTAAYRETGDVRFLTGATRVARYWIDNVPADLVPYWDFNAPNIPSEPRDSSAAAVAASALVELGRLDPDPARRAEYLDVARGTLSSLASPTYLSDDPSFAAVLAHGTNSWPSGMVELGLPWGDYYFAEALARLRTNVLRLGGPDRYRTAVRVSQVDFEAADTVVVASGTAFPDALSASALAGVLEAPILLTPRDRLPGEVAAEVQRLGASSVIVVGGPPAVSAGVAAALDALPGVAVERIAGADRYQTSVAIAARVVDELGPAYSGEVFVVRGDDFADGLAVSPIAYQSGMPVLLTRRDALPGETAALLRSTDTRRAVIAGGQPAVSSVVEQALRGGLGLAVSRVAGADRYGTAVAAAEWALAERRVGTEFVGCAAGTAWADALAGGPATGKRGGVLLMTRTASLPAEVATFLQREASLATSVQVFGGEVVVSGVVENDLRRALPEQ